MTRFSDIRRIRALAIGGVAAAALLLPGVGVAWTTNAISLDPGSCGRNLQIGSDKTASSSATPTFLLQGNGGRSSYAISIDGRPIGTFRSTNDAVVCISVRRPLANGRHRLTGTELAPKPGRIRGLRFSVDTVRPKPPSRPVLSDYADTGVRGDGVTTVPNINLGGTATPNGPVQIYSSGATVVAGARTDATGRWSATTIPLTPGTYTLTAVAFDSAGNRSVPSAATRLTIAAGP